jgi:ligand-binding SRPBCC domain-containing protein
MTSRLELSTTITATAERCFDLSCDIDVHAGSMAASQERAVAGVTSGPIGLGQEVTWEARHFGVRWRVTSRITEFDRPRRFVDEMQRGPFAWFHHEHRFEQHGNATTMVDIIDYGLPLGLLGAIADAAVVGRYLRRLIETRNRYIKQLAEAS